MEKKKTKIVVYRDSTLLKIVHIDNRSRKFIVREDDCCIYIAPLNKPKKEKKYDKSLFELQFS